MTRALDKHDPGSRADRQFYGRKIGHRLRAGPADRFSRLIPALRLTLDEPPPLSLTALFPTPVADVWLEIGFGGGEHIAAQATANPSVGLIGVEPFINGISSLLGLIEAQDLGNVRIFDDEALPLLKWLPAASIARAFVLFPDPWPKRRHEKRRLISEVTAAELGRIMRPGAEFRFATDAVAYAAAVKDVLTRSRYFQRTSEQNSGAGTRPPDWPETRYERKARAAGRSSIFLSFARI